MAMEMKGAATTSIVSDGGQEEGHVTGDAALVEREESHLVVLSILL
jgi:hypothetical protein